MSGISSVRNSGVPEINKKAGDGDDELKVDVGLTVRLQHKLKETQMAKEKLEKRLEILEQQTKDLRGGHGGSGVEAGSGSGSKRNADSIKINELEIENARLKQDLKRLRETISNNNNHDEASMDQMKELMDQFETLQVEWHIYRILCLIGSDFYLE